METAKPVPSNNPNSSFWNRGRWIRIRDAAINRLLAIDTAAVLNPAQSSPAPEELDAAYPARELIRAANRFKAQAMDSSGRHVDYTKLAGSEAYRAFKSEQTAQLRNFDPDTLDSRERKLPFWINLYNVLVIDGVISYGIEESVTEKLGLLRFFRQASYIVGGQRVTPEDIEHGILRANRGNPGIPGPHFPPDDPRLAWALDEVDPRIHFALNCASRSCPPVGVYSPDLIDAQLNLAAGNFIRHETTILPEKGELRVSRIFNWYGSDFGARDGVLRTLLAHLAAGERRDWLEANQGRVRIRFEKYDWRLNR